MSSRRVILTVLAAAGVLLASYGFLAATEDAPPAPAPVLDAPAGGADGPPEPAAESGRAQTIGLERVASGLNRPTYAGAAPGDDGAIWVLEQPGRLLRLDGARRDVVLDLRDEVSLGAEQGLLGIAFHPDFASNRRAFLHFTDPRGDTRVVEHALPERGSARFEPRRELLRQRQPEENHNGGQLAFGPDGRLHLGLGDGGGAFDPRRTAQDLDSRLGKILATRVDGRPDWEVVVYGLRNPWRFSFDFALGELWIADVGQDRYEEVHRLLIEPDEPPKNAGWSAYEGVLPVDGRGAPDQTGELIWPVAGYTHDEGGCSVTGGHVYRGSAIPQLQRRYVYGDFCTGALWTLEPTPKGGATDVRREAAVLPQLTHIGVDSDGELLLAAASGEVYRATPASTSS